MKQADTTNNILNATMQGQQAEQLHSLDPTRTTTEVLSFIPNRMRMVVTKRFGLEGKEKMTLEEIGKKEGITRERVRQIESEAIDTLAEKGKNHLKSVDSVIKNIFNEHGNILEEDYMHSVLLVPQNNTELNQRALLFLLTLLPDLTKKAQNKKFNTIWLTNKESFDIAKTLIDVATAQLESIGNALNEQLFLDIIKKQSIVSDNKKLQSEKVLQSYIAISKEIKRNPFQEWGLSKWPEITPKGVKDKAYIIAKKNEKPLHFTEIAEKINETKFDHKTAYPQTVHNELIKDNRFVLVGRGIYALQEWGYQPGTVLEVLTEVLKKNGGTMTRDQIIEEVLKFRKVRRNTIILNLQNAKIFEKIDSKTYKIKTQ